MIHYGTKDTMEEKMPEIIKMPHLGETMEEGRIVSFYVKEGDFVKKGDPLFDAETDKTVLTVESFREGFVRKVLVKEDDVVKVGEPVLLLTSTKDKPLEDVEFSTPEEKKEEVKEKEIVIDEEVSSERKEEKRILATPLAKKLAKEEGIELSEITPQGEKIKREDVERYLREKKNDTVFSPARKAIGERMTLSKTTIPHFYLTISVDMEKIKETREILEREREWKLSYTDFLLKALAISLRKYPHLNAYFTEGRLEPFESVNIGIAIDTEESLIVPVLKNLEKKTIHDISNIRRALVEKAFEKRLTPDDMKDATFTVSNLGPYNIEEFSAIINPPQVGILAVGKVIDTPYVVEGKVVIRPIMKVTLSADHRAVDGAYGAKFLNELKILLENPVLMWE